MCGVAGIFAYHYAAPNVDRKELLLIREAMINRGPDGAGEWISQDERVGLAHRRLAIIDLTEAGAQPMSNQDGSLVVSFNGEIYNYKELRVELEKKGYRFKSNSDTEVLLHLYADKGEVMVHDLRGMFAFILWDQKKKALWMVRDPYGIKPLYYANDGWTVRVASQVKALLKSPRVSKDPEPAGIVGFFLWGSVPEPFTTYQEIRSVPAGSYLWVDELGVSDPTQYFSVAEMYQQANTRHPSPHPSPQRGEDRVRGQSSTEAIRDALKESLKYHFISDVPVALFLSSGIDSGTLAALTYELGLKNLTGITLSFDEFHGTKDDEVPLAKKIADQYGMKHIVSRVTKKEFEAELPKILESMDQPSMDGINTYFVSKAAKDAGFKVAISGLGGDELFGGYPSFVDVPFLASVLKFITWIPGLGEGFRLVCGIIQKTNRNFHPKMAGLLKYGGTIPGAYFLKRGLFMPWELSQLKLDKTMVKRGLERLRLHSLIKQSLKPNPKNDFASVASLESSLYMKNQLLRDADWAGMAHALEIRTPLVDRTLLEKAAEVGTEEGLTISKSLLADLPQKKLPNEVFSRPKTGFLIPQKDWIQAPGKTHSIHWSRDWSLYIGKQFQPRTA